MAVNSKRHISSASSSAILLLRVGAEPGSARCQRRRCKWSLRLNSALRHGEPRSRPLGHQHPARRGGGVHQGCDPEPSRALGGTYPLLKDTVAPLEKVLRSPSSLQRADALEAIRCRFANPIDKTSGLGRQGEPSPPCRRLPGRDCLIWRKDHTPSPPAKSSHTSFLSCSVRPDGIKPQPGGPVTVRHTPPPENEGTWLCT